MDGTNSPLPSAVKERQYSDSITRRRKALFQSDSGRFETDNELGLIDSLHDSVGCSDGAINRLKNDVSSGGLDDYIIFDEIEVSTPKSRGLLSSTHPTIICETPLKPSPSEKLKTPNDSYSHNEKLPKLIRKSLLDTSFNETNPHLTTPTSSPKNKPEVSSVKVSKVRTALFPEDISFSVKSFYPKSTESRTERPQQNSSLNVQKPTHKPRVSYICKRKRTKNSFGQINAGVRHKIRKPKKKNSRRNEILKAVENIIENSPLNEYLEGIAKMKLQKNTAVRQTVETPVQIQSENPFANGKSTEQGNMFHIRREIKKRAHSPDSGEENRKFFKSSRSRAVLTLNKNIKVQIDYGPRQHVPSDERKILFDDLTSENPAVPDDFNGGCSIERILSILDSDETKNFPQLDAASSSSVQNFLLSPTSEMCDLTSGLALNSPSKAKLNINPILERCSADVSSQKSDMGTQKLFPIFYPDRKTGDEVEKKKETDHVNCNAKKWKMLPKDQLLLDAGQKRFGATQCPVCKIVYHMGDPNDELMHMNYHEARHILRFNVSNFLVISLPSIRFEYFSSLISFSCYSGDSFVSFLILFLGISSSLFLIFF